MKSASYEAMKKSLMSAMKQLYPDGPHCQHQHRDLIMVFIMGYVESMKNMSDRINPKSSKEKTIAKEMDLDHHTLLVDIVDMALDPLWMPGDEWMWWTPAKPVNPEMN